MVHTNLINTLTSTGSISDNGQSIDWTPTNSSNWFTHIAMSECKNGYRFSIVQMFGYKYFSLEELKLILEENGYSSNIVTYVKHKPRRVLRLPVQSYKSSVSFIDFVNKNLINKK